MKSPLIPIAATPAPGSRPWVGERSARRSGPFLPGTLSINGVVLEIQRIDVTFQSPDCAHFTSPHVIEGEVISVRDADKAAG
ncbi:hypothetical protein V7S57_02265 [Caulobacter sp. CCNWLY153]|uniref:hypothetical protein n=1 Tax=unclassified Caulobacter TaxID=2648921 RepID=UPI002FF0F8AD